MAGEVLLETHRLKLMNWGQGFGMGCSCQQNHAGGDDMLWVPSWFCQKILIGTAFILMTELRQFSHTAEKVAALCCGRWVIMS